GRRHPTASWLPIVKCVVAVGRARHDRSTRGLPLRGYLSAVWSCPGPTVTEPVVFPVYSPSAALGSLERPFRGGADPDPAGGQRFSACARAPATRGQPDQSGGGRTGTDGRRGEGRTRRTKVTE